MPAFEPNTDTVYAAVSGGDLPCERFDVAPGIRLQKTYAHVFASYMVAFTAPTEVGSHHPGPWIPATHDLGFDCSFELVLEEGTAFLTVDRLNAARLCLALLRLHTGLKLPAPVISNLSFTRSLSDHDGDRTIRPMETSSHQWPPKQTIRSGLRIEELEWLREQFPKALALLPAPSFARAFSTYDGASWQPSLAAGVLTLCASLEALMRPGRQDTTKRLARMVAAYLSDEPMLRHAHFKMVKELFAYRGGAAHAAKTLPIEIWFATQLLVRPVLVQCLEAGELPDPEILEKEWRRLSVIARPPLVD